MTELTEDQRVRYVRHRLLPEIGDRGQEQLCASSVRLPDWLRGQAREVAIDYLGRAGVTVDDSRDANGAEIPLVRPTAASAARDPALEEAQVTLCGAFAAVEVIKAIVGVGTPGVIETLPGSGS